METSQLGRAELRGLVLSGEQRDAFEHLTKPKALSVVVGYAGTGKSAMLGVAREAWEHAGYRVRGGALSGIAAENLEAGSGINSRTLASLEHQWQQGRELLGANEVLVIDEAGMIGTRQMERVISEAEKRGAKVVLVGDPEQLQAIEAGAAFRSIAERHGAHELTQIRRQREDWQRDATRMLATERTAEAIASYDEHGHVHAAETREQARADLIEGWDADRKAAPNASRLILTHTNDEVQTLNGLARERLRQAGGLGEDVTIRADRGERKFAPGDRIMFLRNERGLGVKNGSLGRVDSISSVRMAVLLDDGRAVAFDLKDYAHVDHGYAATIHKAQGVTVDRVHVLATPGLDRHAAYVGLSRHRDRVDLHYGSDDFTDRGKLVRALSRERRKDMPSDYAHEHAPVRIREAPGEALPAAVGRHARIVQAMQFARSLGEPYSDEQRTELQRSRANLDTIRPLAARDLESAMVGTPALISQAAAGKTANSLRAMQLEAEMRGNPQLRADVFVQRWQSLDRQRRLLLREQENTAARKIAGNMMGMAKSLERDPQVESLLRNRKADLGLPGHARDHNIGHSLGEMIGRTLGRGVGIAM